ncbi:MAG: hypothetical protein WCO00_15295 [Rhodospirillaceae bacterium]
MPPPPSDPAAKAALLAELRQRVARLEGGSGRDRTGVLALGVPELDGHLPGGGLARGCLHEIAGTAPGDDGAAIGFAALVLSRLAGATGRVIWLTRRQDLYPPGLAAFGLTPEPLILVTVRRDPEALWAMEEALRCPRLAAVLGEVDVVDLVASRRLQLAAERGGVTGLLLRPPAPRPTASAATTRWRLAAATGAAPPLPGLGPPRWRADLVRCRGGRPGCWLLDWRDGRLALIGETAAPDDQRSSTTRLRPWALAS